MNKSLLIIFAKNPELGKVKTRLAATVGNEVALAIYFQLLQKTREVTESLKHDKVVYYSNHLEEGDLWREDIFRKAVQSDGDLGERMKGAFTDAFEQGYERVCIIGSDCMDISTEIIEEAFGKLHNRDAVIGASQDGGYYLLGMSKLMPELFDNKAWSTDEVFVATIEDFIRLGLDHAELPVLNDIDTEKDLGDWASVMSRKYQVD
ncbi:MAG: TIGR04282 family arsenosugar biosynthesis glycosyltransferase [Roseivirga sp.]